MAVAKQSTQRYLPCQITGCKEYGRAVATLGGKKIAYCAPHRKKYGERIINALINSLLNYKLSNYLTEVKSDVFTNDKLELCECCNEKFTDYFKNAVNKFKEIQDWAEENEADGKTDLELLS